MQQATVRDASSVRCKGRLIITNIDRKQLESLGSTSSNGGQIAQMQTAIHKTAREKGWWDEPRQAPECIALMHSELSEALEGYRLGNPMSEKIAPFSQIEEELADVIIRILDYAEANSFEIEKALMAKMAYNETRPYRHGGKLA